MIVYLTQAWKDARLVGGLKAFYESGTGDPTLELYDGAMPVDGGDPGAANMLAICILNPVITFAGHQLVIAQLDPAGDLITTQGNVSWGRMRNRNSDHMMDGDATVLGGGGAFQVQGTVGTLLYLGARAILGTTVIV